MKILPLPGICLFAGLAGLGVNRLVPDLGLYAIRDARRLPRHSHRVVGPLDGRNPEEVTH
jgi:hypothetical protein